MSETQKTQKADTNKATTNIQQFMDKSRFLDDPFPFISFLCTAIWRHIKGGTILFDIPSIDQLFDLMFSMSHA